MQSRGGRRGRGVREKGVREKVTDNRKGGVEREKEREREKEKERERVKASHCLRDVNTIRVWV